MACPRGYRGDLASRFEEKTIPEPNSGCLLWVGAYCPPGYGRIVHEGKIIPATHAALLLEGKPVPEGKFALHKCDNPCCVNVEHLFIGDALDNSKDMFAKGRQNFQETRPPRSRTRRTGAGTSTDYARGERVFKSKLTSEQVLEIRSLMGKVSQRKLALMFGVTKNSIKLVLQRKTWGHVGSPAKVSS